MKSLEKYLVLVVMFLWTALSGYAQNIDAAEYFFDTDPGLGNGIALAVGTPADSVSFNATVSTTGLSVGNHLLYVRTRDDQGRWSLHARRQIVISGHEITEAEYFYNTDPGVGNGISIPVTATLDSISFNAIVATSGLQTGYHLLYLRTKDERGKWSLHARRKIYIEDLKITAAEYFYNNDPGVGNGIAVPVTSTLDSISFNATVATTGLQDGYHMLYLRTKDNRGKWSLQARRQIHVVDLKITAAEYFYNTDPGVGNGIAIPVTATLDSISFNATVATTGLQNGYHMLYLRTKDNRGKWSLQARRKIHVVDLKITAAEYFYDTDPGVGNGTAIPVTTTLDSISFNATVATTGLQPGYHLLYLRTKDARGKWSLHARRKIYISDLKITAAEYFYDTDPGVGNGTAIPVTATLDSIAFNATVNTTGLPTGTHWLYLRTKSNNGTWALHKPRRVYVKIQVAGVEIFFDTDPGLGSGYAMSPGTPSDSVNWNLSGTIPALSPGVHYLYLRTKDDRGKWSHYSDPDTITIVPGALTWTGVVDHNWNLSLNWTPNQVPTLTDDIIIPDMPNDPELYTGANGVCDSMSIDGGATLTLTNTYTLTLGSSWNNASGTVNVYGPGEMIMAGAGSRIFGVAGIDKLKISPASGSITMMPSSALSVKTSLTLEENNFNAGAGSVTFVSTPTVTAFLNDFGGNTGTYTGNIKMQRYLPTLGFHYIGSAVNTPSFSELSEFNLYGTNNAQIIASNNCSSDSTAYSSPYGAVFEFNESNNFPTNCFQWGWNIRSAGSMSNARGYSARLLNPPITMEITGAPNTGTISYPGLSNSGGFGDGFHLVSNPYPSPLVWNNPAGFDGAAYFWQSTGSYLGTYQSYLSGTGHSIASQQGFIVRVGSGTSNFTFSNSNRTTGDPTFFKSEWYDQLLTIDVEGNGYKDKTVIYFSLNNTDGWDSQYDARKLPSRTFQPTLFTNNSENENIGINGLPPLNGSKAVPMGLIPGTSGHYEFTATDINTFNGNTTIFLQDLKTGTWHDLVQNPIYPFDADETDDENRFIIHFNPQITGMNDNDNIAVNFYSSGNTVVISYAGFSKKGASAALYNLQGQQVLPFAGLDATAGRQELSTAGLTQGIYIAYVFADGKTFTSKVFVR